MLTELQSLAVFSHFSEEALRSLASVMLRRVYAPGEFIFWEGERAVGMWFILSGHVRILKFSSGGRTQALCIADRGKCFGTCPLFDMQGNPASAQAVDEVTLLILPHSEAQHLMRREPALVQALLQIYSERLGQLAKLSECLGTWSVPARLNDCLLSCADLSQPQPVVCLTHEKLAELAGTVREVASRHLAHLAEQGLVELDSGCIRLLDKEALKLPCLARQ